jgi:nicotinamide-nucleotide amidase
LACSVEIICVGNELLIGKTLNTNAQWLADQITKLGGKVTRIAEVGDDVQEIASVVKDALRRKVEFVITSGGLGPTFDDKTLQGISRATGRKLKLNTEALRLVRERYTEISVLKRLRLTKPRVKMAILPQGSSPIPNPVGTAPGVLVEFGSAKLISLPGVPKELKAIFEKSVAEMIREKSGNLVFYESSMIVRDIVESALAPLIDGVMQDNPRVYVKSHPKGGEGRTGALIELHFSSTEKNRAKAREQVIKAIIDMVRMLGKRR